MIVLDYIHFKHFMAGFIVFIDNSDLLYKGLIGLKFFIRVHFFLDILCPLSFILGFVGVVPRDVAGPSDRNNLSGISCGRRQRPRDDFHSTLLLQKVCSFFRVI